MRRWRPMRSGVGGRHGVRATSDPASRKKSGTMKRFIVLGNSYKMGRQRDAVRPVR